MALLAWLFILRARLKGVIAFLGISVAVELGKVLAGAPFRNPTGQVQLVLLSGSAVAPSATFDPGKVGSVLVRSAKAASAADFTGC